MQPFDLEKALAGAKLVTRDGREVTSFTSEGTGNYPYVAYVVPDGTTCYTADGRYHKTIAYSPADLFLAEEVAESCTVSKPVPSILEEAQKLIYGDRQQDYGSVTTNFTNIAKGWEVILGVPVTPEQVGLAMAWVKIARQVNRKKRDNLIDIAGYIGCIDKIEKGE